jgi:hypothetical protein
MRNSAVSIISAWLGLLLAFAFVVHLILRRRSFKTVPFYRWWVAFWIVYFFDTLTFLRLVYQPFYEIRHWLNAVLSFLGGIFLVLASESVGSSESRAERHWGGLREVVWIFVFCCGFILDIIFGHEFSVFANFAWYIGLCLLGTAYFRFASLPRQWVTVLIFLWAGLNLIVFYWTTNYILYGYVSVLLAISIPFRAILYFAGYVLLSDLRAALRQKSPACPKRKLAGKKAMQGRRSCLSRTRRSQSSCRACGLFFICFGAIPLENS